MQNLLQSTIEYLKSINRIDNKLLVKYEIESMLQGNN